MSRSFQLVVCKDMGLHDVYLSQISPALSEGWTQERRKSVSATRVNASLRTLRRALRMAEEWKLIKKVPKIKMLPGERQREFVISETLLEKMLKHEDCTDMLLVLLPFLIDVGLRISEATGLTWERVGLEPKQDASLGWVYIEKGKSKFAKRHVPLTPRAHDILEKLKKSSTSAFVFPAAKKGRLSRHWASEQFRTLRDAMKLPDDLMTV
jgi:integrase